MNESNNICFICLNGHISLKAILQNGPQNETALQVRYVLPELTFFDNVYICTLCTTSLYSFYTFKKRCLENYNRLMHNTITQTQKLIDLQTKTLFNNEPEVKPEQVMDVDLTDELIIKDELLSPKAKEHQKRLEDLIVSEDNSEAEGFPQPEFVKCEIDSDGEDSSVSVSKNLSNKEVNENYGISENSDLPQQTECTESTKISTLNLIPDLSRKKYEAAYTLFMDWRKAQKTVSCSENVLLAYFYKLSGQYKSSTLWTQYSMLRTTLNRNNNVDIGKYHKLRAYLKRKSDGYKPKKSKLFTTNEINKFIKEAPNEVYLLTKVVCIMGIMGACRRNELYNMKTNDLNDLGSAVLVTIPDTKTKIVRKFSITGHFYEIFKKYALLRPPNVQDSSFFLNYQREKCTVQKVGINKFGAMGKQIAKYLNLPTPELYTSHCFRISAAKILADAGKERKRHGGWYSSSFSDVLSSMEDTINTPSTSRTIDSWDN